MENKTDLKEILSSYLKYWKWFLASLVLFIALAVVYLRYTKVLYQATAKVKILEEDGNGGLDLFDDIDLFSIKKNNVLDEIEIIKSRSHLIELVQRLKLNTQIFEMGDLLQSEKYHGAPVNFNFVVEDSILNKSNFEFFLVINSANSYSYSENEKETGTTFTFGKKLKTSIGEVVLTPNLEHINRYIGKRFRVAITPVERVADFLKEAISIELNDDDSNIVNVIMKNGSKKKAKDVIGELISIYNENAILDKKVIADRTATFIDNRIAAIAGNLSTVDESAETLRTDRGISDLASETSINLNVGAANRQELANAQNQYNIAKGMSDLVEQQDQFEVLPSNIGLSDPSIASTTARYNQLLQERNRLLKSSNLKNPMIVNLDEELRNLRKNLKSSLNGTVNNLSLTVNTLSNQQAIINSRIYSAPKNERALRDITRKQQTTESLYLYLLQKKEEAQIAAISTSPKCKVVDYATTGDNPVAPRKMVILMAAGIFGLLVPFSVLYAKDLLDTKVKNMKTIEELTKEVPVIGELPKVSKKELNKILKDDRSVLGESLRIIRTNLDYLIKSKSKGSAKNNIIFISSSISGEGKTFVSSNLAMILSNTSKKVLLIGADIRNPKIYNFFIGKDIDRMSMGGTKPKNGLTEYIIDEKIEVKDIVNKMLVQNNEIDVIYSGKIPPNPAELLLSGRIGELFDKVCSKYDYVLVDTAPLMLVTDTLLLTNYADHLIYVTRSGVTEKRAIDYPIKLQKEGKLSGLCFLVNDVADSDLGYGGMYSYGYGKAVKKWWSIK
ncbi:polysaccharide biosynthesis tyrosine autokinase [Flagellimonas sp. DF-77]|uniref:GumC family protein n=1 Tax=Flagellimonas algarum TaxID=3230298 RepID=UPI003396D49C